MKNESKKDLQRLKKRVTRINNNIKEMKHRADHPTPIPKTEAKKKRKSSGDKEIERVAQLVENIDAMVKRSRNIDWKKKVGSNEISSTTRRKLRASARTINKRIRSVSEAGVVTQKFLKEVVGI